ncbi:MAG: hypothetical protein GX650_03575, partial [Clostridiales bacterium]|nr:hypothetical protein [Clostridiales bacterium]
MFAYRRSLALLMVMVMLGAIPAVLSEEGAAPSPQAAEQMLAGPRDFAVLEPLALDLRIAGDQMLAESERYNAAVARFGDSAEPLPVDAIRKDLEKEQSVGSDTFYDTTTYFQLSPSGNKLFFISGGIPAVYDRMDQQLCMLVPDDTMGQEYFEKVYLQLMRRLPDDSLVWSQDEQYLAVAAPMLLLLQLRLGTNILLMDLTAGTVRPLVPELPVKVSLCDLETLKGAGAPLRAGFDGEQPVLYYEAMGAGEDAEGERYDELRSYDLLSGQTQVIASYPMKQVDVSPRLWSTPQGLLHTFASVKKQGERGLAIRPVSGNPFILAVTGEGDNPVADFRMLDMAAGRGLLMSRQDPGGPRQMTFFHLLSMEELTVDVFDMVLAVDPGAAPEGRLRRLSLQNDLNRGADNTAPALPGGMQPVVNGALSPDGKHLLLVTSTAPDQAALWLYSFEQNAL